MIPTAIWYVLYHLNHFLWILEVGHFSRCMVGWVPEELLSETVQAMGFPILLSTWHVSAYQSKLYSYLQTSLLFARKLSASLQVYFAFFQPQLTRLPGDWVTLVRLMDSSPPDCLWQNTLLGCFGLTDGHCLPQLTRLHSLWLSPVVTHFLWRWGHLGLFVMQSSKFLVTKGA